jgi:hypothetical protein
MYLVISGRLPRPAGIGARNDDCGLTLRHCDDRFPACGRQATVRSNLHIRAEGCKGSFFLYFRNLRIQYDNASSGHNILSFYSGIKKITAFKNIVRSDLFYIKMLEILKKKRYMKLLIQFTVLFIIVFFFENCEGTKHLDTGSEISGQSLTSEKLKYIEAYNKVLTLIKTPFDEIYIPTTFGNAHVIVSGPVDAPPVVLLHGLNARDAAHYAAHRRSGYYQ